MAKKEGTCGHINKQFINADGLPDQLVCELPEGHEGNHQADYKCLRATDGSIAQAKLIAGGEVVIHLSGKDMITVTERGEWMNEASTIASEVRPDLVQLAKIKASKGDMLDAAQVVRKVA